MLRSWSSLLCTIYVPLFVSKVSLVILLRKPPNSHRDAIYILVTVVSSEDMQVLEEVNYLEQQADAVAKAVSSEQGGSGLLLCLCGFSEATLVSSHNARTHKSATWLLWMAWKCDWFHDCVSCSCVAIKEIPHTLLTYSSFPLCKMFFSAWLNWIIFLIMPHY